MLNQLACLVCDSDLSRQVQVGIFDGHFVSTAVAVLVPFAVFLLVGAAVHFAVPKLMAPKNQK
jgi:hypothetical protein